MAMCHIQGRGKANITEGTQGANKPLEPEPTGSGNIVTRYHRLLHQHSTSLDLETAFRSIHISRDIKPDLCKQCKNDSCICPAFTFRMPCSSASSTPTNIEVDEEQIPDLVENSTQHVLYPPVQSPSDEEADREVAAICNAPVYYRVKSRTTRRCRYYMYNLLDIIDKTSREKR